MSYLNNLRLVFSGRFQSDVSTVNNDVTHYNSAKFKPEFQEYGMPGGWWNPCGSGAFRLIDCRVNEVAYSDGTCTSDPKADPTIGMLIGGSNQLVSSKMVDLDPQMQMVSEIWGLDMRLTDGKTDGFFSGRFLPAPFKDILFGRQQDGGGGDQTATAIYQSVLEDLSWVNTESSPFLQELKRVSSQVGKLSVRMMVYSYNMDHNNPEFTLGHVSGVIGPALEGEPNTFILGRRFAPQNGTSTAQGINFFNAQLNRQTNSPSPKADLCVDFSNALPLLNGNGDFVDIGQTQLVALNGEFDEGTTNLSEVLFTRLGDPIPYLNNQWMKKTGAIFNIRDLSGQLLNNVQNSPLALLNMENNKILIRETQQGLLVRADQVVHRLNPTANAIVDLYTSQYGEPLPDTEIEISLQGKSQGTSGGQGAPFINHPAAAIAINEHITTDRNGKGILNYEANTPGNPRGYIDGQVYLLSYTFSESVGYIQHAFDFIANLVFDGGEVPVNPTWTDIQPIMTQYGNLYPVMSRMLVDLGSYDAVSKHRSLLELAFSRPINDPNYMPVTRDLSEPKRTMILKWLTAKGPDGQYLLLKGDNSNADTAGIEPCDSCMIDTSQPVLAQHKATEKIEEMVGSKLYAAKQYKRQVKH